MFSLRACQGRFWSCTRGVGVWGQRDGRRWAAGSAGHVPKDGKSKLASARVLSQVKVVTIDWHRSLLAVSARVRYCVCRISRWQQEQTETAVTLKATAGDGLVAIVLINTLQPKKKKQLFCPRCAADVANNSNDTFPEKKSLSFFVLL